MKRFYTQVTVVQADGGWQVQLDGRGVKSAVGCAQVVPSRALAEALAAEWAVQEGEIDTAIFGLRDLADYAIDSVAPTRNAAIQAILRYGESDTLCYRGDAGEALHARQLELWEPLLRAAERRWDVHFERISGIIHRPQPQATLARMASALDAQDNYSLAALHTLASLSASLVVAMAAIEPGADAAALWQVANLEEDWQSELWGKDAEAEALRERRLSTFAAAMRFAQLART